jgi:hypothetical protein
VPAKQRSARATLRGRHSATSRRLRSRAATARRPLPELCRCYYGQPRLIELTDERAAEMAGRLRLARVHGVGDERLRRIAAKGVGMGDLPRARQAADVWLTLERRATQARRPRHRRHAAPNETDVRRLLHGGAGVSSADQPRARQASATHGQLPAVHVRTRAKRTAWRCCSRRPGVE